MKQIYRKYVVKPNQVGSFDVILSNPRTGGKFRKIDLTSELDRPVLNTEEDNARLVASVFNSRHLVQE